MLYRVLADSVVFLHFAFMLFVVLGGFVALRWRWVVWVHLPAAVWGTLVELVGWYCPLTALENRLLRASGTAGYTGSFIEEYLLPVIYPAGLTRPLQLGLGIGVIAANLFAYGLIWRRRRVKPSPPGGSQPDAC